jgi:VWFA-related protein
VAVALFGVAGSSVVLSMAAQAPQPPTFRTGVRLVEIDVVVRDDDDRFVDTLTKDDFEILEDGAPRQIQQLWVVNLPIERRTDAPVAVASSLALVGSAADVGRLYVLVLHSGGGERVRSIAGQFITEFLGPTDLMAVVHVGNRAGSQGLTANRELLLASVDRYRGAGSPEAALGVLKEVAISLTASTGRRKAVLFIGPGFGLWSPPSTGGAWSPGAVDRGVAAYKLERVFQDLVNTAKRNNVRIYPIDPVGWRGEVGASDVVASLRILAADTGGISIANTNNYRGNFPQIVRDNSAYYLLTYDSAAEADGRAHPITVRLRNRPDLSVRQGRQSFTAPTPDVKGRSVRLPGNLSAAARSALAASSPVNGPAIELFTAVFQASKYNGSILIGTHVPGAVLRLTAKDKIELSYVAVDRWGAVRAVERRAFTLNLGAQSRARVERTGLRLFGRLQVPRGQYQIRVAAPQANGATASAMAEVEVPDYMDQPLTVSDFVVASSQGPTLTTLEEDAVLRSALPAQPTPVRRFERDETLTVFAEIYDSHWIVSQEVGVTMTVAAADGRLVFRGEQVLTTANRGRFYLTAKLPLGAFEPGDYQLLVEVHTRKGIPANASRQTRFAVLDADASAAAGGATP